MPHPAIVVTREGPIATVTIDRAAKRNAMLPAMWTALGEAVSALSADTALRCVVLQGAGDQAFCAGADIGAFQDPAAAEEERHSFPACLEAVRGCLHPVVAACQGWTMGGGCGLASMADFRIGSPATRMAIPARNLGIWYPPKQMDVILQIVGYAVAAELFLEGRVFTGEEAAQKGLLTRLVADGTVNAEAHALAERIAQGAPLSARHHKRSLQALRGLLPLGEADLAAAEGFRETADFKNAVQAFLDKRKPVFEGR